MFSGLHCGRGNRSVCWKVLIMRRLRQKIDRSSGPSMFHPSNLPCAGRMSSSSTSWLLPTPYSPSSTEPGNCNYHHHFHRLKTTSSASKTHSITHHRTASEPSAKTIAGYVGLAAVCIVIQLEIPHLYFGPFAHARTILWKTTAMAFDCFFFVLAWHRTWSQQGWLTMRYRFISDHFVEEKRISLA
jgi:hypothetical protein